MSFKGKWATLILAILTNEQFLNVRKTRYPLGIVLFTVRTTGPSIFVQLVGFGKRFPYWIEWGSSSSISTVILQEGEQMIRNSTYSADTCSEHLTHSDDCLSVFKPFYIGGYNGCAFPYTTGGGLGKYPLPENVYFLDSWKYCLFAITWRFSQMGGNWTTCTRLFSVSKCL